MKIGITMEGGASRTIFSAGVTDAFLEENIMPDYFIGVSAGMAYGLSYLAKQKGRELEIAQTYMADKRYMGVRHLFEKGNKSLYNIPFVFDEIPNKLIPLDVEEFKCFPGKAVATVTNIHSGKAEYLEVPKNEKTFDLIVASCSLPILFQPVKIGKHYYLDGGISDSIPFKQAIKEGCDKNIVILTRERGYVKKQEKAGEVSKKLYKKYPKIAENIENRPDHYNACMKEILELEEKKEIFVIAPKTTYGMKRTEANPDKLKRLYNEGYQQAKLQMKDLKKYLEV